MKTCRQINYAGRVQGVGFRYTVKQIAVSYDVTGWVRNLPDGTVEIRACGEAEEVELFIATVADGQLRPNIKEAHEQDIPGDETMPTGFEIRH